jgi:hypothetical protein
MSPVQSVTDVPVHSLPLAAFACSTRWGVAGRVDLLAEEGGGRRTAAGDREETPPISEQITDSPAILDVYGGRS